MSKHDHPYRAISLFNGAELHARLNLSGRNQILSPAAAAHSRILTQSSSSRRSIIKIAQMVWEPRAPRLNISRLGCLTLSETRTQVLSSIPTVFISRPRRRNGGNWCSSGEDTAQPITQSVCSFHNGHPYSHQIRRAEHCR